MRQTAEGFIASDGSGYHKYFSGSAKRGKLTFIGTTRRSVEDDGSVSAKALLRYGEAQHKEFKVVLPISRHVYTESY